MQNTPVPHRLIALWFADIVGYSACAARDEGSALQLVEVLQTVSSETVQRHEGRVVKFVGDAALAEFPSTEMAVRAATALSERFSEQSARAGYAHHLRVGVHVGDVAVGSDGDLYGDAVNAAARMQEAAEPGQIVVSQDVWRQLRGRKEFNFESLGDRTLKGIGLIGLYVVNGEKDPAPSRSRPGAGNGAVNGSRQSIRSIAVLPFADLSPEHDQEYFSDGVAEEILNALSKVNGLQVAARTSSFAFRGGGVDVREIGNRLGVETLLDGSIRKAGNQLRITVQLVDASNGYQLWSRRLDREIKDIFAIQDEIAHSVLAALRLRLKEERRSLKSRTANIEAYEFYLRGRKFFQKWTRQNVELARQMFTRAVEHDPQFALAWAALASSYVDLFRWGKAAQDLEESERASARALELDPGLAEGHVAAGQALAIQRRYADAGNEFERAIALDPTLFDAYYLYGRVLFESGDPEKSARFLDKAQQLRPEDYLARVFKGQALLDLGRLEEAELTEQGAVACIEKHLELNPDEARAYNLGANLLVRLGDTDRAREWGEKGMALAPNDPLILYNAACLFALLGETERALDALEAAVEAGMTVGARDWITHDPDLNALRDHPRFQAVAKRMNAA